MKILMVLPGDFPPDIRVENEALSLQKAGHSITIACQTRNSRPPHDTFNDKIKIVRNELNLLDYKLSAAALSLPFYFKKWDSFLSGVLKTERFDAIHIHDLPLAKIGYKLAEEYRIPMVLDLHENWPALLAISQHSKSLWGKILINIAQWKAYELEMCRLTDKIIVVVDEAKSRLLKHSIPESKISIVSNTLNASSLQILSFHKKKAHGLRLFYGGGINKHRGLQVVLNAMALVRNDLPEIQLDIVGDGSYVDSLKKLCEDLRISDIIKFYGHLPFHKMGEVMANADIALIPHLKSEHTDATIPHKIFQYMYMGIPILSSDCDPLVRIINECKAGLIYKNDSAQSFAEKLFELNNLLINNEFHHEIPRENVLNKYVWEIDSKILISTYNDIS